MADTAQLLKFIDAAMSEGIARGIAHRTVEDTRLDGRSVTLDEASAINFASCSYLGLEVDPRLKAAVVEAVERYGTQFSSSRSYASAPGYRELEALLDELTGGSALVSPNTTLAHLSALPVLVGDDDAVILDHQVHHTVQLAVPQLRQQGVHVEFVRHERLDLLDERIRDLCKRHPRVWYLADGVYSMYGNLAALDALRWLAAEHEQLHLYIDDAHGTSWCGAHGRGFALSRLVERERCFVAISLNKAFGAAGGALVFPDRASCERVRKCGGPMIFTGPVQPPMLGAAIASAKIHLSDEIGSMQRELMERVRFANRTAAELGIPLANDCEVPIRFVALGQPVVAYDVAEALLRRGFLTNCAVFPAVPAKRCGVRFTLTRHHALDDIRALLEAVADVLPGALAAAGSSREQIDGRFGLVARPARRPTTPADGTLECRMERSIEAIDRDEWNRLLGGRGSFDWDGVRYLEDVFARPEASGPDRWDFFYFTVRDASGAPVLATFFTEALWKDDMLSPPDVSRRVEALRERDPDFLTSRVLSMGSLFTEGDHLYLDRDRDWRGALQRLADEMGALAEERDVGSVVLRDLEADEELATALGDMGFSPVSCPDSLVIDVDGLGWEELLARLTPGQRRFQRRKVAPHEGKFAVEVLRRGGRAADSDELDHLHGLYGNVVERSLELNTFPLPDGFLRPMLDRAGWEIVTLTLKPDDASGPQRPHAFFAAWIGAEQYAPMVIGLDYRAVARHGAYRQCLREVVRRAQIHGSRRILMGMGAALEKVRFGARPVARTMFVQSLDHYAHDVLALIDGECRG